MADEDLQFRFDPNNFTGDKKREESRYADAIGKSVAASIALLVENTVRKESKDDKKEEQPKTNQQTFYDWGKPSETSFYSVGDVLSFGDRGEDKKNDLVASIESLVETKKEKEETSKQSNEIKQKQVDVKKEEDSFVKTKRDAQIFWEVYYENRDTKAEIAKNDERARQDKKSGNSLGVFASGVSGLATNLAKMPFNFASAIRGVMASFAKIIAPVATKVGVATIGVGTAAAGIAEILTNEKARIKAITDMGGIYDEKTKKFDISKITNESDKKLAQSLINEDGTLKSADETSLVSFLQVIGKNFKDLLPMLKDSFIENIWDPGAKLFREMFDEVSEKAGSKIGWAIRNVLGDIFPFIDSYNEIQEDRRQEALGGMNKSPYAFSRRYVYDKDNETKQWVVSNFGGDVPASLFTDYLADTVKHIMKDKDLAKVFSNKFKDEKEEEEFFASEFFIKWANSVVKKRSARSGNARTFIIKEGEDTESLDEAIKSYTKTLPIPTVPNDEVERKIGTTEKQQKTEASVEKTVDLNNSSGQTITNNTNTNNTYTIYNSDPTGHASAAAFLTA